MREARGAMENREFRVVEGRDAVLVNVWSACGRARMDVYIFVTLVLGQDDGSAGYIAWTYPGRIVE